jgi:energy-coupling factor transport system permease protein
MSTATSPYLVRHTGLHRLNPLTKLAIAGFLLVAAVLIPGRYSYGVFLLGVVPLSLWGQISPKLVSNTLRVTAPFAVSLLIIQSLFWQSGPVLIGFGPLSIKTDGVLFAINMIGRILLVVSTMNLLILTTRPDHLMLALRQRGLPDAIAYIVLTTMQIIPRFQMKATTILDAQRARGLETQGSLIVRIRALLPLIVPLVLGSIVDVEERAIALEGRAFSRSGPKTTLIDLPDSTMQHIIRWSLLAAALLILVGRLALPKLGVTP